MLATIKNGLCKGDVIMNCVMLMQKGRFSLAILILFWMIHYFQVAILVFIVGHKTYVYNLAKSTKLRDNMYMLMH